MNRMEEYNALMEELEHTPTDLEYTMTRVQARAKKHQTRKTLRFLGIPAASLAGVLTAFIMVVNFSIPAALACMNVPVLKELMEAVAFSDSLKAMVQNDFVQPVNQTQSADGAEMTIHYLVYDGTEMHVFYTASYNGSTEVEIAPDYTCADGSRLGSVSWSTGLPPEEGEMGHMSVGIHSGEEFPAELKMTAEVYPRIGYYHGEIVPIAPPESEAGGEWDNPADYRPKEEPVAVLEFDLKLEERFIRAKRTYTPHAEIDLEGRVLIVEEVAVYPTGTRLTIREPETNNAELSGLTMWLEDGKGKRVEQGSSGGLISSGDHYWMKSVYFEPGDDLTLCIAEAKWLEKEKKTVTLDLVNYENSDLPEGITLIDVVRNEDDLRITFLDEVSGSNFCSGWYDEAGELHYFNQWSSRSLSEEDHSTPPFENDTYIWDYTGDTVEIALYWNEIAAYDPAVRVPLG